MSDVQFDENISLDRSRYTDSKMEHSTHHSKLIFFLSRITGLPEHIVTILLFTICIAVILVSLVFFLNTGELTRNVNPHPGINQS